MNRRALAPIAVLFACAATASLWSADDKQNPDEVAVRKAVADYVEAFNRHDAKALANMWSEKAEYLNPMTGRKVQGRQAIEKEFTAMFKNAGEARIEATTESVRLLSKDVAIEEGIAHVVRPGELPEDSTYTAVYVKQDGKWLLDTVRETDLPTVPSHYDELKSLEWIIGTWEDTSEDAQVKSTYEWTKNRNFIKMTFNVSVNDRLEMEGVQVIGWDPVRRQIRSWTFDSDGSFAEAVWTQKGNRCTVKMASTLADGRLASAVNVYTRVDDNKLTWESTGREVDGVIAPNVGPITVVRKSAEPAKP